MGVNGYSFEIGKIHDRTIVMLPPLSSMLFPARAWFMEQLTAKLPKSKILDPVPLQTYQV